MTVVTGTRIPLVDLGAQYQTIRHEVLPAIEAVMERSAFIHGPFVAAFEAEMAAFAQAAHEIRRLVGGDPAADAEKNAAAAIGMAGGAGRMGRADAGRGRRAHSVGSTAGTSTGSGTGAGP